MTKRILVTILSVLVGVFYLIPLLWMFATSLLPDQEVVQPLRSLQQFAPDNLSLQNYAEVFARVDFWVILLNTVIFTGVIVFAGLVINSAAGYALARLPFAGQQMILLLTITLIIIPYESLVVPLFLIIGGKWRLMNTLPGLFLPYLAKAFNIFIMRQHFLSLPKALEDSARIEGASWFTIFWRIGMPLAKPALATVAILDFTFHWSEYLWPLIITNAPAQETIQIGLGHFYTLPPIQWGDIMAYSVLATLPMLFVFLFFQHYIVANVATSGMKGA